MQSLLAAAGVLLRSSAGEALLGLPGAGQQESDLGLLRTAAVLSVLALAVYDLEANSTLGSITHHIRLPSAANNSADTTVACRLLHMRLARQATSEAAEAGGDRVASGLQYGCWEVEGLGIVVAFRGTASMEDILLNGSITPARLGGTGSTTAGSGGASASRGTARGRRQAAAAAAAVAAAAADVHVHSGFLQAAASHSAELAAVVRAARSGAKRSGGGSAARQPPPPEQLLLTGHSLGGACATAMLLHLMAAPGLHDLLEGGCWALTFGAPFVLHSSEPTALYRNLDKLLAALPPSMPRPRFNHIVNGMDAVPRLLGSCMGGVHSVLERYVPALQPVRQVAAGYSPVGSYHFLVGGKLRSLTPKAAAAAATSAITSTRVGRGASGGASSAGATGGGRSAGSHQNGSSGSGSSIGSSLGDAVHADEVCAQLGVTSAWKAALLSSGQAGFYSDHSMTMYKTQLNGCLMRAAATSATAAAAAATAAGANGGSGGGRGSCAASRSEQEALFATAASPAATQQGGGGGAAGADSAGTDGPPAADLAAETGRAVRAAGSMLMASLSARALAYMNAAAPNNNDSSDGGGSAPQA